MITKSQAVNLITLVLMIVFVCFVGWATDHHIALPPTVVALAGLAGTAVAGTCRSYIAAFAGRATAQAPDVAAAITEALSKGLSAYAGHTADATRSAAASAKEAAAAASSVADTAAKIGDTQQMLQQKIRDGHAALDAAKTTHPPADPPLATSNPVTHFLGTLFGGDKGEAKAAEEAPAVPAAPGGSPDATTPLSGPEPSVFAPAAPAPASFPVVTTAPDGTVQVAS